MKIRQTFDLADQSGIVFQKRKKGKKQPTAVLAEQQRVRHTGGTAEPSTDKDTVLSFDFENGK